MQATWELITLFYFCICLNFSIIKKRFKIYQIVERLHNKYVKSHFEGRRGEGQVWGPLSVH